VTHLPSVDNVLQEDRLLYPYLQAKKMPTFEQIYLSLFCLTVTGFSVAAKPFFFPLNTENCIKSKQLLRYTRGQPQRKATKKPASNF